MILFHRNKQSKYDSCSCTGSIKWKGPLVDSSTITLLFVFPFQCLKSYKALCENGFKSPIEVIQLEKLMIVI